MDKSSVNNFYPTAAVRPKIGLALGGGGARGLAHIGALKILAEADLKPDYLAGTSIGAIIGASLALGKSLDDLEALSLSFNRSKAWRTFVDVGNPRYSFLAGKKMQKFVQSLFGRKQFSDCKIPLSIVTTDLANGQEVVIQKGSIAKAVLASIAIPGLLPPVKYGNRYLVDGGSSNVTPVSVLAKTPSKVIIAVDVSVSPAAHFLKKPTLFTTLIQAYTIIRDQSIKYQLSQAEIKHKSLIIVRPTFNDIIDTFQFNQIPDFIVLGEAAMRHSLPTIRRALAKAI